MGKYIDIQNAVIEKYHIDICDGSKCSNDWRRTHAHPKQRRVCKWKQVNSLDSTFTLLHEIGHIETYKSWMRRAESEFYATEWAIEEMYLRGLTTPDKIIKQYQSYIDREKDRGLRRGGKAYPTMSLELVVEGLKYTVWNEEA